MLAKSLADIEELSASCTSAKEDKEAMKAEVASLSAKANTLEAENLHLTQKYIVMDAEREMQTVEFAKLKGNYEALITAMTEEITTATSSMVVVPSAATASKENTPAPNAKQSTSSGNPRVSQGWKTTITSALSSPNQIEARSSTTTDPPNQESLAQVDPHFTDPESEPVVVSRELEGGNFVITAPVPETQPEASSHASRPFIPEIYAQTAVLSQVSNFTLNATAAEPAAAQGVPPFPYSGMPVSSGPWIAQPVGSFNETVQMDTTPIEPEVADSLAPMDTSPIEGDASDSIIPMDTTPSDSGVDMPCPFSSAVGLQGIGGFAEMPTFSLGTPARGGPEIQLSAFRAEYPMAKPEPPCFAASFMPKNTDTASTSQSVASKEYAGEGSSTGTRRGIGAELLGAGLSRAPDMSSKAKRRLDETDFTNPASLFAAQNDFAVQNGNGDGNDSDGTVTDEELHIPEVKRRRPDMGRE
ncbi:hypothetical protein HDU97_005580 [Phlyctochytrium planicorne]|nr:hypothetical protein HDU97_005580 [Phlyctochytrium planicorne]